MFGFFKKHAVPEPVPKEEPRSDAVVDAVLMSGVVLPPYPAVLIDLDRLLARDDFELGRLVEVVARDPSLMAALLRVANSPVFGLRRNITGLQQAVAILGLARVRAVLRSAVLREALRDYADPALVDVLWGRFDHIGKLAASLAARSTTLTSQADLAYSAGMFHGTGIFILAKRFPEQTRGLAHAGLDFAAQVDRLDAELETDHVAISAMVARNWRLQPEVVAAIAHQRQCRPGESGTTDRLTCLLHLSIGLHDGEGAEAWASAAESLGLKEVLDQDPSGQRWSADE